MLDVTVCIMSHNRPAFLREALRSVLAQARSPRKIAVYDHGSDKAVQEGIRDLLGERVEWVGAAFNHPFIWNFGRAMSDCESEFAVMLHDDDKLCPEFLGTQIALLKADLGLAAVSCNGYVIDQSVHRTGETLARTVEGVSRSKCILAAAKWP